MSPDLISLSSTDINFFCIKEVELKIHYELENQLKLMQTDPFYLTTYYYDVH